MAMTTRSRNDKTEARMRNILFELRTSSLIRHSSFLQLRFFDLIPAHLSLRAPRELTGENRGRVGRKDLVAFQDEFWVDGVAGGLVDLVATKVTVELVFVIIVAPEIEAFAIGGQLLLLIQHNQL